MSPSLVGLASRRNLKPVGGSWESEFRERMDSFRGMRSARNGEAAVSLKVRVTSGCFHREHSPGAYAMIDEHLSATRGDGAAFEFIEHESGPELLVLLALGTAGLGLAKSVIDLLVAMIEARREGVKQGDRPSDPIEVIVRRVDYGDTFREERILRIACNDPVDPAEIETALRLGIERLAAESDEPEG
jgi:hypothetical protein